MDAHDAKQCGACALKTAYEYAQWLGLYPNVSLECIREIDKRMLALINMERIARDSHATFLTSPVAQLWADYCSLVVSTREELDRRRAAVAPRKPGVARCMMPTAAERRAVFRALLTALCASEKCVRDSIRELNQARSPQLSASDWVITVVFWSAVFLAVRWCIRAVTSWFV